MSSRRITLTIIALLLILLGYAYRNEILTVGSHIPYIRDYLPVFHPVHHFKQLIPFFHGSQKMIENHPIVHTGR
jgi:hypothetical protein